MSKVSEAKAAQGWRKKPDTCVECSYFTVDCEERRIHPQARPYVIERNLRCSLGGFKTGKTSICDRFEQKAAGDADGSTA